MKYERQRKRMSTMFSIQSARNRFIIFTCLCTASVLFFLSSQQKFSHSGKAIHSLFYVDIINRIQSIEERVESIQKRLSDNVRRTQIARYNAELIKASYNNTKASYFWTGVNELEAVGDLFSNRSEKHKTCLVTQSKCQHEFTFLILITTHISHFARRHSIRSTWANDPRGRWRTAFLVGRSHNPYNMRILRNEVAIHEDLILGDVYEDFYNLTAKVQMGFEWAVKYCKFKYLLKGDDDVFINFPRLFSFVQDDEVPKKELYAGNVQYEAKVFRSGRYGISKADFPKKKYPRYCSGGGFILSRDVVVIMLARFDYVKSISIDDAYIGALALKCGIDVYHDDNFKMFEDEKGCVYKANTIVHHPVKSVSCMSKLFNHSLSERT